MKYSTFFQKLFSSIIVQCVIVLCIAAFFRLYNLSSLPFGFHNDEVMNGYVGRFIIETGKDLYGNRWPLLYFDNFGDYPNVLPMYLSGLGTYLFGVTELGVRFPIAIFGIATVGLVYLICRWLFRNPTVAFLTSLLLAVLPWHVVLSRATAEGVTAAFVFLLGITLICRAVEKSQKLMYGVGVLLLLLTYLLYPSFRILVPLSSLGLVFLPQKKSWRVGIITTILLFFGITGLISQTEWGRGRYQQTSVFTYNQEIPHKSWIYSTGLGSGHVILARVFHNKYILAGREVVVQYFSYFSAPFLLGSAGLPERYNVPENGQIYYLVVGLVILTALLHFLFPMSAKKISSLFIAGRVQYFLLAMWIFILSPLPSALTLQDAPNIHRAATTGVLLMLVCAFCIAFLSDWASKPRLKKAGVACFILLLSLETIHFWHYYVRLSSAAQQAFRNEEQRALAQWLIANNQNYQEIFAPFNNAMALHYLFHSNNFSPELAGQFQSGMRIDQVGTVQFVDPLCEPEAFSKLSDPTKKIAFVTAVECKIPPGYIKRTNITYASGSTAFYILEQDPSYKPPILAK